jgi:hypothetical protein
LYYSDEGLSSLNVSKNPALMHLECRGTLLNLDVSKNTALTYLDCAGNQLTNLNVSECTALTDLDCHTNQFSATVLNALLTSLPVRGGDLAPFLGQNSFCKFFNADITPSLIQPLSSLIRNNLVT